MNKFIFFVLIVLILNNSLFASSKTQVVFYPINPDHQSDGLVQGCIEGRNISFEYQHTYHFSSRGEKDFKANYTRLAADGPIDVTLQVKAPITVAYLRTIGKDLPFKRQGSTFHFTLPGPGNYYLQLPDLNTPGRITYTVFFFIDALEQYQRYQQEFSQALNVTQNGVVSSPFTDQTQSIQGLIDRGGAIYFPAGMYRTGQLSIPSNTTLLLGEGAVLKGTDAYCASRYIHIENSQNVRMAGLGVIDANGNVPGNQAQKGHLIDLENCSDLQLEGILFRHSNSWMLHIRRSQNIVFNSIHLFSGKDGIDPDGSSDVLIEKVTIQSIDDAFAVKSKFEGESCERVTIRDCIVFSCASSLKIGTENYYGIVQDIIWDNCDAVDADRGIILYTNKKGSAPVRNITWRNIRIFNYDWEVETGGAPFQFENRAGNMGGDITDILVQNVMAYPQTDVDVEPEAGEIHVTFQNVVVHGESKIEQTQNLTFKGVLWENVVSESVPAIFIEPSPHRQTAYRNKDKLTAWVFHPFQRDIKKVDWFIDGELVGTDTSSPFTYNLLPVSLGEHRVQAAAMDEDGQINQTAPKRIEIIPEVK
ncbi:hypothetical protein GF373_05760 [bacterium]|nr:hypothetical protein [bacterium]